MQAMAVTCDPEHKFELALGLGDIKIAYTLAKEAEVLKQILKIHTVFTIFTIQAEQKWKQLAALATSKCEFTMAQECLHHAQDFGGLLLLATSAGNDNMVKTLATDAEAGGIFTNK